MNFLNVSNSELEQKLFHFVAQERKLLHVVLLHIKEVDNRKLYLEKSRSSLYEYLVKDVGYSSSSAQRRIEGARLLREIPELSGSIESGKINLSQICEVARSVKQSPEKVSLNQKMDLLKAIECKTTSETQAIVAKSLDIEIKETEFKRVQKDESVRLEITLSKEQYAKLMECRDLDSHTLLNKKSLHISDVIEFLCDKHLKSTAASAIRRVKASNETTKSAFNIKSSGQMVAAPSEHDSARATEQITMAPSNLSSIKTIKQMSSKSLIQKYRKCITPKVKKEIFQKLKVCQHRDPSTKNLCGSSFLLQVDHRIPKWAGGSHEDENLTLLCANHNQLKYRKETSLRLR